MNDDFPPDWHRSCPWLTVETVGVRRAFRWPAMYLKAQRLHYWLAYWNPTPGATLMVEERRVALTPAILLLVPARAWFQRACTRPFDQWWCHYRIDARPAAPGAQVLPVDTALGDALAAAWAASWRLGSAAPTAIAASHAALALALARVAWQAEIAPPPGDPRLAALVAALAAEDYPVTDNTTLAARVGLHPKAFGRRFQQVLGCAPQTWLRERRLEQAAERLGRGVSVEEAAALGGFTDRFHFSRLFRRLHGVGPGAYRRQACAGGAS